jgi:hypothetical protein
MTDNIRTVVFSSSVFGGFTCIVEIDRISSVDDVLCGCVGLLTNTLEEHNFTSLLSILEKMEFHIHDVDLEKIHNSKDTIYICEKTSCHPS